MVLIMEVIPCFNSDIINTLRIVLPMFKLAYFYTVLIMPYNTKAPAFQLFQQKSEEGSNFRESLRLPYIPS